MRPRWSWLFPLVGFVLGALAYGPVRREAGATALLLRLSAPLSEPGEEKTRTTPSAAFTVPGDGIGRGSFRARLYVPPGPAHRCLVVGHGVHYLGIDEPRLVRFARELSREGAVVLTPELRELADYQVTRSGADVLAHAVRHLAARCAHVGGGKVGLVGFSFAGGLALLAAERPDVQPRLAFVMSVGGYHDLSRVLRFFLTNRVETLHGPEPRKAHEYGLVVLLYEHLDALLPEVDRDVMRDAVRAWLHEDRKTAWAVASRRTTPEAEALFLHVTRGEGLVYADVLARIVDEQERAGELAALSPKGRLHDGPTPLYLLHGAGDRVIPPEETLFADQELQEAQHANERPHRALVTALIEHVELGSAPPLVEGAKLVDFMSLLL